MNPIVTIKGPAPKWMRDILADEFTKVMERALDELLYSHDEPKAPPFQWLTHGGELLEPSEMPTPHLYYALRMIFNHSVSKRFQTPESIHPVKKYPDVPKWSLAYRKAAINALSAELATRNPKGLTPAMQDGLRWMKMATRVMLAEGL